MLTLLVISLALLHLTLPVITTSTCRNVPGDPGFPSTNEWTALNASISGRLVPVVPSAKYCQINNCTTAQWTSSNFRVNNIPGAMNQVNWEDDFDSNNPSFCLRNSSTKACGQGNVPLFAVLAESASDIQKAVQFAHSHNLRLAVKSSGHDYLGRSTAKNSLLIHTHKLQNITFTDNFVVGRKSKGPAVTVGSGVNLSQLYTETGKQGKIYIGGFAATVAVAGGYVQGAGHSALSPFLGLAADSCFEFTIVLADGSLVTANEDENPDLFWALRGGGAGSWGVITSATFQTFLTFNATFSNITITTTSNAMMSKVVEAHAAHIFDWDDLHPGQYFQVSAGAGGPFMTIRTYFPKTSTSVAALRMLPFINEAQAAGAVVQSQVSSLLINKALLFTDNVVATNTVLGSRLIPASVYHHPRLVGETYKELLDAGTPSIHGNLVAGGKVAQNHYIRSAVHPAWRTAKTHVDIFNTWQDGASIKDIHAIENVFRNKQLSILENIAGKYGAAYSNEADVLERDFQNVFYGPNYARLSEIKRTYDPNDLFIVRTGVGSERWDSDGLCKVT